MRIALAKDAEGKLLRHFGTATMLEIYEISDGQVQRSFPMPVFEPGIDGLSALLKASGVDALLCCELAKDWKSRLLKEGFAVHSGIMGTAQQAVQAFLTGTLTGCGGEGEGSCGGDCNACGSCDCGCGGH